VRLFVAVWPARDVIAALRALARPPIDGVRWTPEAQWHVTLRFLGEIDDAAPVVDAVAVAAASTGPCLATIGPRTRLVQDMVWAPVDGLVALATAVVEATATLGAPPERRPFRGHVTLARARRGRLRGIAPEPVAGAWTVDAVDVVRSRLGKGPAAYETVATLPLGGPSLGV